jgi:hypothetical protein
LPASLAGFPPNAGYAPYPNPAVFNRADAIPSISELKTLGALQTLIARRIKNGLEIDARVILIESKSPRHIASDKDRVIDRRLS